MAGRAGLERWWHSGIDSLTLEARGWMLAISPAWHSMAQIVPDTGRPIAIASTTRPIARRQRITIRVYNRAPGGVEL